jgi:hypothetical protein
MLGRRTVDLVEYSAEWPLEFERERAALAKALGSTALLIEHIGSTPVPGLVAQADDRHRYRCGSDRRRCALSRTTRSSRLRVASGLPRRPRPYVEAKTEVVRRLLDDAHG